MTATEGPTADPFARQLMAQYLGRRRSDVSRLRTALVEQAFDTIQRAGHNMFGSGAAYGFETISRLGARLETAAENRDARAAEDLIDELDKFLRRHDVA